MPGQSGSSMDLLILTHFHWEDKDAEQQGRNSHIIRSIDIYPQARFTVIGIEGQTSRLIMTAYEQAQTQHRINILETDIFLFKEDISTFIRTSKSYA